MADFTVYRGTDAVLDLVVTDEFDQPVDLSLASLWFTVKKLYSQSDLEVLFQKTLWNNGIAVSDPPEDGKATVFINAEDTRDHPFYRGKYHYDLLVELDNQRQIIVAGDLIVEPTVIDPTTVAPI